MNERTVFLTALEKEDSAQRRAYLDDACADDAALRERVEELLKSHEREGKFLNVPAVEQLAPCPQQKSVRDTGAEARSHEDDVAALDFLAPSEKAGSLGRLGHYEIQEVTGHGGMGIVLRALDETLHRVVAIKVMAAQLATNGVARRRFMREAQAVAAVSHDNVVTIHAVEEANGLPYIAMQYVNGLSLQQRLDATGSLELKEILRIGMQTAAGLAAAHAQGIVHRDIKPANILLENGVERVKITDFGLARAAADASLTQSGVVAGTPQYMSPEQADGGQLDQRSDLFSLGSVLYAMCTGRAPFRASGTMAVLKRVCEETPRPIRETNPDIPDWLVALIDKLHAKAPTGRYQTAAEVAVLLNQHLAQLQQSPAVLQPSRGVEAKSTKPRQDAQTRASKARPWSHSRRWAIAAAVFLCLVAGVSLMEVTGVTNLRAIVIRDFAPEGTKPNPAGTGTSAPDFKGGLVRKHRWFGRHAYFAAFSADSRYYVATGSADGNTTRVWEVATGNLVMEVVGNECAVFMPDNKHVLAAGPDKQIHLWELATGKELRQFGEHPGWISTLDLTPDGQKLLSGCSDGVLRLWDVASGTELAKLEGHAKGCKGCFSPDGKQILSAGYDGTVRLWDVAQSKEIREWPHFAPWSPRFAVDGRHFVTVTKEAVFSWDTAANRESQAVGLLGQVGAAGISADGRLLLYAKESDTTVRLLELPGGKELANFEVPFPPTGIMNFSPDGQYAVGASTSEWVYLWRLPDPPVPAK